MIAPKPALILEAIELLAKAVEAEPAIEKAVIGVFSAVKDKQPLTPALKYAEAVAYARELGLDPSKV
jgi:hypothetical protein